jgi:hypothetical protein
VQVHLSLVRDARDRALPSAVFVSARPPPHRPVTRYTTIRIHSKSDLAAARKANLPISMFDSLQSEELGYPLSFKPVLMVAREYLPVLETGFRTITFGDTEAARSPAIEDFIVTMLQIDTLGARRIAKMNAAKIDPLRLLRQILAERLEGRAYRVRLDEFAPGLPAPPGVTPISKRALAWEDRRAFVQVPRP